MPSSTSIDWTAVGSIATALALVLGIGTLYWQHRSQQQRDDHDRSKFALDSCLSTYRIALEQLEDGNNNRVTWVMSARMIQRANELAALVTAPAHIAVLEVEKELLRDRAASVLGYDDPTKGEWFYLGHTKPEPDADTTGSNVTQYQRQASKRHGPVLELSLDSVGTIYALASFPKGYEEPLRSHDLESHVGIEMRAGFPGLFDYVCSSIDRERATPGGEDQHGA
jgi:hypothetical protein